MPKRNVAMDAGRKALSTDGAQEVVGTVEEVAIRKVDDAAGAVKDRAAKAGRRAKKTTAKRSPSEKTTARKATANKTTAKRR